MNGEKTISVSILTSGAFGPEHVTIVNRPAGERLVEASQEVERIWKERVNTGVRLFDGKMLQYLGYSVKEGKLTIETTSMSYKMFVAARDPNFREKFRVDWKPLSVGTTLESSDGFLLLGKRRADLDSYPGMISSFAGWVDPTLDTRNGIPDLFEAMNRELEEETRIGRDDAKISCLGLLTPRDSRFVYAAFHAVTKLSSSELSRTVTISDEFESVSLHPMEKVESFLEENAANVTPDCHGNCALLLRRL